MSTEPASLRILVIADDPLARNGLVGFLQVHPEALVVASAASQDDLSGLLSGLRPDLIVWDLGWDPASSLEALEGAAARRGCPILALLPDSAAAGAAWSSGARAPLLREADGDRLWTAVRAVAEDLTVIEPAWAADVLRLSGPGESPPAEELTAREMEVLHLMAEGLPNKGIAARLGVSEHTAKFHVNAILRKLGAQSRTEAVVRATRRGLILL